MSDKEFLTGAEVVSDFVAKLQENDSLDQNLVEQIAGLVEANHFTDTKLLQALREAREVEAEVKNGRANEEN